MWILCEIIKMIKEKTSGVDIIFLFLSLEIKFIVNLSEGQTQKPENVR